MEQIRRLITANDSNLLSKVISSGQFELTVRNKEDLVKHAAECGYFVCLKVLVENGYPVSTGWDSPVKPAASKGHLKCLKILVEALTNNDASIDSFHWLSVPLFETITGDHADCLLFLLETIDSYCSNEEKNVLFNSALFHSVRTKQRDSVRVIIENGFTKTVPKDSSGKDPLWYAIAEYSEPDIVNILLNNEKYRFSCDSLKAALDISVRKGNQGVINTILNLGYFHIASQSWSDLIHTSVKLKNLAILDTFLKYLQQRNAIKQLDVFDTVCTATKFKQESLQIVSMLTGYAVNIEMKTSHATTAIIESVKNENTEILDFFLNNTHLPLNRMDNFGLTALMHACRNGNSTATELLLKSGADPNCKTSSGKAAIFFAVRSHDMCVKHLLRYDTNINVIDHVGQSPLLECARLGNVRIMKMLIDKGANLDYYSSQKNALYHALDLKHYDMVLLLISAGISTSRDTYRMYQSMIYRFLLRAMKTAKPEAYERECANALFALGSDMFREMRDHLKHFDPSEDPAAPSLSHLCRAVIRRNLLDVQAEKNIFHQVPLLPLPPALQRYVLYGVSLCSGPHGHS